MPAFGEVQKGEFAARAMSCSGLNMCNVMISVIDRFASLRRIYKLMQN